MVSTMRMFVCVVSVLAVVTAHDEGSRSSTDRPKTAKKRGLGPFGGVPGVLYSQYSPHVHTVPVPHPFPVPVPHPVPVQVPRPFPVTVHKPVGLPIPVGVPVPVNVPVPKPYPVPVPVNIPHGPSPFASFGGSPFGALPAGLEGAFPSSPLGSPAGAFSPKFGYGLGVYNTPGTAAVPLAHPDLAAALSSLAGHASGLPAPWSTDPLAGHPSKF